MKRSGAKKTPEKDGVKAPATRQSSRKKEEEEDRYVWLDSDATSIDCDICFMPFEAEVFMCVNGHAACAECCTRMNRKCSCCGATIGGVRCRPAEKMLAEMNTYCKFSKYGCTEAVKYVQKRKHEETCPRAPYGCPVDGCSYRGMNTGLYEHVLDEHARNVPSVAYLQDTTLTLRKSEPLLLLAQVNVRKVFLLLNGDVLPTGRSLSLVCLGPSPEGNVDIKYKMEVCGSDGGHLALLGTAPCIRQLEGFEAKKFLFVPDAYWPTGGLPLLSPSAFVSVDRALLCCCC